MQTSGNTVLITGGNSGIGRGLAEAFLARGNDVIITGRDRSKMEATVAANPGLKALELDVDDPKAIAAFGQKVVRDFPTLNVLVNNAGIMRTENLADGSTGIAEATIMTNLLGPIRLTAALLPHLQAQASAAVLNVSSGLAFVPRSEFPSYCATKAAIHSWSQTLRRQMRDTSVEVIEIAPPYVQTMLTGEAQASDPNAMPLDEYITETMSALEAQPQSGEILVKSVFFQRWAEREGRYDEAFARLNA